MISLVDLMLITQSFLLTPQSTIHDCEFQARVVFSIQGERQNGMAWWEWLTRLHNAPIKRDKGFDNAYMLGYVAYSFPLESTRKEVGDAMYWACDKYLRYEIKKENI